MVPRAGVEPAQYFYQGILSRKTTKPALVDVSHCSAGCLVSKDCLWDLMIYHYATRYAKNYAAVKFTLKLRR